VNNGPVLLKMVECQMFPSYEESAGENYGNRLRRRRGLHFIKESNQYGVLICHFRGEKVSLPVHILSRG
jgi:hypothetical protein